MKERKEKRNYRKAWCGDITRFRGSRDSFKVLSVLNNKLDKAGAKDRKILHLLKVKKNMYALQSQYRPTKSRKR